MQQPSRSSARHQRRRIASKVGFSTCLTISGGCSASGGEQELTPREEVKFAGDSANRKFLSRTPPCLASGQVPRRLWRDPVKARQDGALARYPSDSNHPRRTSGKLFADQIVEESAMAGDCPADAQTVAAPNPLTG